MRGSGRSFPVGTHAGEVDTGRRGCGAGRSDWFRDSKRVPIVKLAALSKVSPEMLRKVRRGERQPSAKTLGAIMPVLAQMLDEAEG